MPAGGKRRRLSAWSATLAALPGLLGGCSFDNADQYAELYGRYLDTRTDIASYTLHPNNAMLSKGTLDSTITMHDGLSDDHVATTARELVEHEVNGSIAENRIRLFFDAHNLEGGAAVVSIQVQPGSTEPRMGDPNQYPRWVHRTRVLASRTNGLTELSVFSTAMYAKTTASVIAAATELDSFVTENPAGIAEVSATGADCVLQWDTGDDLTKLFAYRELLAVLPAGTVAAHCRATSQRPATEPSFYLTVPRAGGDQFAAAMRARATELGLPADITIAA